MHGWYNIERMGRHQVPYKRHIRIRQLGFPKRPVNVENGFHQRGTRSVELRHAFRENLDPQVQLQRRGRIGLAWVRQEEAGQFFITLGLTLFFLSLLVRANRFLVRFKE